VVRRHPLAADDAGDLREEAAVTTDSKDDFDYSTKGAVADFASTFAGVLLLIAAAFSVIQGISAIADDDLYAAGSDYLYQFNMTTWGWIHLIIGVLSAAVAVGILIRAEWGQLTGIIVASLAILTNFAFLPHYPLWAVVVIAFNAFVIWALCTQMKHHS
jgi:hypothetical protein